MEKDYYPETTYGNYKKASLSGKSGKRKKEIIKISLETYQNNLKKVAIASAITVSLAIAGGMHLANNIKDGMVINNMAYQFQVNVISPETHRTDNNQYYFYDYNDIADRIEAMDNPDLGYYLFYKNTGTYQTDKVLQETRYGGFDEYLAEHNYENEKDFSKTMEEVALSTNQLKENMENIDEIQNEHTKDSNGTNEKYGGK